VHEDPSTRSVLEALLSWAVDEAFLYLGRHSDYSWHDLWPLYVIAETGRQLGERDLGRGVRACDASGPTGNRLLSSIGALRAAALFKIAGHLRLAHQRSGDIALSDWITGIVIPAICYVALIATGCAFVAKYEIAFSMLAGVTLVVLLSGIYGAWEMMLWMAIARSRKER
jgi:hypothetical protein